MFNRCKVGDKLRFGIERVDNFGALWGTVEAVDNFHTTVKLEAWPTLRVMEFANSEIRTWVIEKVLEVHKD